MDTNPEQTGLATPASPLPEGAIFAAIERAARDTSLRAMAASILADNIEAQLGEKPRTMTLRGSDAGRCSLELWAEVQGALTLPVDVDTRLARFDLGNLIGAWLGALLKVGLETASGPPDGWSWRVALESRTKYRGIPIQPDAVVRGYRVGLRNGPYDESFPHVVEFKSTYSTKSMQAPHADDREYQVWQAGMQALGVGAPEFSIVSFGPCAYLPKAWPHRLREDRYVTASWQDAVDREIDRLERATSRIDPPEPDPMQAFRCGSCRFGDCARNQNGAR